MPDHLRNQAGILGHSMTEMKASKAILCAYPTGQFFIFSVHTLQLLQCVFTETSRMGISL